jgi:tRNA(fMet)-specific endonuclease VapC
MKLYVLDTDTVTLLLHGEPNVCTHAAEHEAEELAITIITVEEILTGWYSQIRRDRKDDQIARAYQALQEAVEFAGRIRILPFDLAALQRFRILKAAKTRVGSNDLKIAAIVQQEDMVLVTRNMRDFQKLPGLQLENWA